MSKKCRLIFIGKLDFQSIFNKHVQAQRLQPGLGALRITQSNPTVNILLTSLKKTWRITQVDLSADLFLGDLRRSITLHDSSPGGYLDSAEGNYNPSSAAIRSTDGATIVNFTLDLHLVRENIPTSNHFLFT